MKIQKLATIITIFLALLSPVNPIRAQEAASGFVDDSIRDMTIVLGSGVGGAILGLSTLSFVEVPSDHMKNVAVGGAIGIVIGVTVVMLSQASRTTLTEIHDPINKYNFASIKRAEFREEKIAANQFPKPNFTYGLDF